MTARAYWAAPLCAVAIVATPAQAATPRQILSDAAFTAPDKASALAQIARAESGAVAVLARNPGDQDAALTRAMAIGYRAKLGKNRNDAMTARKMFETLAAANPRDAEAVAAVGTWHLDSVSELGAMVAGMVLGAKKAVGLQTMDRAVSLGGNRAMFPALAGMLRLSLDSGDARARGLIERGAAGSVTDPVDRIMQRGAMQVLAAMKAGNDKQAQTLARQLLPFGRIAR